MKDNGLEFCSGFKQDTLFGFDFWTMVSILAGGGGLVLILFIVLVTVSCRACKRRKKHQEGKFSLRCSEIIIISYHEIVPRPDVLF